MVQNPAATATRPDEADRSIVLIGMMGAGKSAIGRRLASALALPFADVDDEIERAANMSVSAIFEKLGEAAFRDGERRVIARLIEGPRQVIATGGGAFMNPDTRALILARARSIWLDAALDTLVARVSRRDTRPMLRGHDVRTRMAELDAARRPFYALADIRVASDDAPHEEMVSRIIEELAE